MATARKKKRVASRPATKSRPTTRRKRRRKSGLAGPATDQVKAEWINRLAWVGGGVGAAVLGVWGAKQLWKSTVGEIRQNNAIAETTVDGRPAFFANELAIAFNPSGSQTMSDFFGDGTDEEKVIALLRQIPSRRVWEQTIAAYSKLSKGRNLTKDLQDELTSFLGNEDWDTARQILAAKK